MDRGDNMMNFGSYLRDYLEESNISQSEFAIRLGVSQKHINNIINGKANMSIELIANIERLTNINSQFIIKIEQKNKMFKSLMKKFKSLKNLELYIRSFYIRELEKEKWVSFKDKTNSFQIAYDLLNFLKIADFGVLKKQEENMLFKKNGDDFNKINLWVARCNEIASSQLVLEYQNNKFEELIASLKKESYNQGINLDEITNILNGFGFYFVVEKALKGTKIRGVFLVKKDNPAIYITANYAAKDSFYFELFHELGHCKRDFNFAKKNVIANGDKEKELKADQFALKTMINEDLCENIDQYFNDENKLLEISQTEKIPMSFIVGRLAKNKQIEYSSYLYQKYRME